MTKCFICGVGCLVESSLGPHLDRRKGIEGQWDLGTCDYCGVDSINPRPSEQELNSFYGAYYENGGLLLQPSRYDSVPALRTLYHLFTGDVDPRDFINPECDSRILDYGCGGASYLQYFHNKGYEISGADVAGDVVKQCRQNGLDVKSIDDFNEIPFASDQFDVVYLMQVFEHLRDPNTFLRELFRILVDKGDLYISVPNSNSIWRRIFKKKWVSGYFAPFHLAHYNEKTLTVLAEKHGFRVQKTFYRTPESWFRLNIKAVWHSEVNNLDHYSSWIDTKLVKFCLCLLLRVIELPIRNRDCMTMHLRKGI